MLNFLTVKLVVAISYCFYLLVTGSLIWHHQKLRYPLWIKITFLTILVLLALLLGYFSLFLLFFGYNS